MTKPDLMEEARAAVGSIFGDLRDRRFLKWLFKSEPSVIGDFPDLRSLDIEVQDEIREVWAAIIASALARVDAAAEARGREEAWQDISTAPKNPNSVVDLWCVPPEDCDFEHPNGGTRLANCWWHEADTIFPHTGWVRITDDGDWDLVTSGPTCRLGLPAWQPTHWRQPPPSPAAIRRGTP